MRKSLIAATITAGLLGGGGIGAIALGPSLAGAQATTTIAPATATSPAVDRAAGLSTALQPLVDAGTITAAQRDAVVAHLQKGGDFGHGGRGPGGPGRGGMDRAGGGHLDAAATALNTTADALRTALQGGKSLADVAKAANIDPAIVIKAIVAAENTELDAAVAAGKMTAEQATTIKAHLTTRVTEMVNGTMPAGGRGPGGGRGGPGGHGPRTVTPPTTAK